MTRPTRLCQCTGLATYDCARPIPADRTLCSECGFGCRSWVEHGDVVWHYADPPGTTITQEPT